jgi:hypothetical protein
MGRKSLCGKIRGGMVYMKVAVYATIGGKRHRWSFGTKKGCLGKIIEDKRWEDVLRRLHDR